MSWLAWLLVVVLAVAVFRLTGKPLCELGHRIYSRGQGAPDNRLGVHWMLVGMVLMLVGGIAWTIEGLVIIPLRLAFQALSGSGRRPALPH